MNNFNEFKLNKITIKNLLTQGIKTPTAVQEKTIPLILKGKDLLVKSQTGTGKTLAFLIPIFELINENNPNIQCVILTPTRELARQITEEAIKLSKNTNINTLCIFGGQDVSKQLTKINNNPHIIIATPGRLMDHLRRGTIKLSNAKILVLDEADQMLFNGFKDDIEQIVSKISLNRQILCFSATLNRNIELLSDSLFNNPITIDISAKNITSQQISQKIIICDANNKKNALFDTLNKTNPFLGIIFCRTKRRVDELEEKMAINKYDCRKIHGNLTQRQRQRVIKDFRAAKFQYLITTDIVSRGIDISGISHIYNYDIPENPEIYIHRIGRTGRMDEEGIAITFITTREKHLIKEIETKVKQKIPTEVF